MPHQPFLRVQPEQLRRGAGGNDEGVTAVLVFADLESERAPAQVDLGHFTEDALRPEALGLPFEQLHHLGTQQAIGEARIVFHLGRDSKLATGLEPLDHDGCQIGASGVQCGGQSGGTRADDDEVVMVHRERGYSGTTR